MAVRSTGCALLCSSSVQEAVNQYYADCPAFGTRCTPEQPLGAPMVSSGLVRLTIAIAARSAETSLMGVPDRRGA